MRGLIVLAVAAVMLPCIVAAQDGAQNVRFEFGATLNAVLSDTLDARRNKPGDTVKAKASEDLKAGGIVVIPHGTKLFGHVTESQPAANRNAPARLGIVFERAQLKDGREIALQATFFALAAPEGSLSSGGAFSGGSFGGGFGGGSSGVGDMMSASRSTDDADVLGRPHAQQEVLKPSPGAVGGLNSSGALYASSRGVFGLDDISLEPNTTPGAGSSVVLANDRTVHLASGTRMLLSVQSAP